MNDSGTYNTADYIKQAPGIIDTLQRELMKIGMTQTTYAFGNYPAANVLGDTAGMEVAAFIGTDLTYEGAGACQAYYFEASRAGTVYIEDYVSSWATLATVTLTGTTDAFTAYSGIVTPTSGATKSRIRLSGTYRYFARNLALYNIAFASEDDIPVYGRYVLRQMPTTFHSIDQIVNEDEVDLYVKQSIIKWEGRRDLYIDYFYTGNVRIVYYPVPTAITALTQSLEIDDVTAMTVLPYGLAAQFMVHEDPGKANFFQQRYEELMLKASVPQPVGEVVMRDGYYLTSGM
jgi:hypothetical protein